MDQRACRATAFGPPLAVLVSVLLGVACGGGEAATSHATGGGDGAPAAASVAAGAASATRAAAPASAGGYIEVELGGVGKRFTEFGPSDASYQASMLGGLLSIEGRDAGGASFRIMTSNIDLAALELPATLRAEDMKQFEERLGRQPAPSEVRQLRMVGWHYRDTTGGKFTNGLPKPTLTIEAFDGHRIRGSFAGILHGRNQVDLEMTDGRFDVTLGGAP